MTARENNAAPLSHRSSSLPRLALGSVALVMLATLDGCHFLGDIFKAGVWVGVGGFLLLAALIGGVAMLANKK